MAVVVGTPLLARTRPWLAQNRRQLLRGLTLPLALGLSWWLASMPLTNTVWAVLVLYALLQLGSLWFRRWPGLTRIALWCSVLTDALFALFLVGQSAILGAAIYPLYLLLALRALSIYHELPAATITPFALGPAYLFAESLSRQTEPSAGYVQSAQWSLMIGSLCFGAVAIYTSTMHQRTAETLRRELRDAQISSESRVALMERTAADLRARMRERHALEEGLRAITGTLSLDDVLTQIVDSTMQMLGPARVDGIALSLETDGVFEHRSYMRDDTAAVDWAELIARRVIRQQTPLIVTSLADDQELANLLPPGPGSALSVPLLIGDQHVRGALSVISIGRVEFLSSDARHLTAFAIQAGIAIGNAELHSRLESQRRLLGAVVRDISDGLIVIDNNGAIVLSNPLGDELLASDSIGTPVIEQIHALAESLRTADKATITAEIRVGAGNEATDQIFQAIGSLVTHPTSDEVLTAIVLHDITMQKAEERSRAQFISMVAHELRNPLNSLNGFVKIVLQGRAGALTPLQQEFLQIADSQIDQLKGRISELLEFNRLEAGRLTLTPAWNDLSLLITGTVTRLHLQAEQAGLQLSNHTADSLPECFFDSERIGQVLTNLIENAIKATPPGGEIELRSQLHNDDVWIRVCDTGVGIPADEQRRIFEPFVQGASGLTRRGSHLGLGLAICKQIIEGHGGRLWVESEPGQGSCFTFALPLATQESAVNA